MINHRYVLCIFLALSGVAHSADITIRIPENNNLRLYSADFVGMATLQGQLFLASFGEDAAEPNDSRLLFIPDVSEHDKLPQLLLNNEADNKRLIIELNYVQEQDEIGRAIESSFGSEAATHFNQKTFSLGKQGSLVLYAYNTSNEGDRWSHYAVFDSFKARQDLPQNQVDEILEEVLCCGF